MARNPDLIDDFAEILRPLVPRDEVQRRVIALRARLGGREHYIKVDPAQREARKQAAGVPEARRRR